MPEPIKIRATIGADGVEVRVLLTHPMESGQRRDARNALIPAHYIERFTLALNGAPMVEAELGPAVAKNPLFAFKLHSAKVGDTVSVSWVDNRGETRSDQARVSDGSRN